MLPFAFASTHVDHWAFGAWTLLPVHQLSFLWALSVWTDHCIPGTPYTIWCFGDVLAQLSNLYLSHSDPMLPIFPASNTPTSRTAHSLIPPLQKCLCKLLSSSVFSSSVSLNVVVVQCKENSISLSFSHGGFWSATAQPSCKLYVRNEEGEQFWQCLEG